MKKIYDDYKIVIRFIFILIAILSIVSLIHMIMRKNIHTSINNEGIKTLESIVKEDRINDIDYNTVVADIDNTIDTIEKSKEASGGDNTYTITFYEKACGIMEDKMKLIKDIIEMRLDDESKSQLSYSIDKFYTDLTTDEESIYRVYPSSIDAKFHIYETRYEKLKDKCKSLAFDYIGVLDNKD